MEIPNVFFFFLFFRLRVFFFFGPMGPGPGGRGSGRLVTGVWGPTHVCIFFLNNFDRGCNYDFWNVLGATIGRKCLEMSSASAGFHDEQVSGRDLDSRPSNLLCPDGLVMYFQTNGDAQQEFLELRLGTYQ